jgi:hypothetical protein
MFEEVVAYLVLAPPAVALMAVAGLVAWALRGRRLAAISVEKERQLSD